MKQLLAKLMQRWNVLIVPALIKMGFWGVGLIAIADSSTIPVPMDALLALMIWENKSHFWMYCLAGAAGSAIGGLLPYGLGRAGGELFLLKRVNRERFEQMRNRFEKQEFLAVMVPSMLPPPTPWKAFVFAAGVFDMRVAPFMLSVFCGRLVRWGILSFLVIKLGPSAVSLMSDAIKNHMALLLSGIVLIFVLIGVWVVIKRRKAASQPSLES